MAVDYLSFGMQVFVTTVLMAVSIYEIAVNENQNIFIPLLAAVSSNWLPSATSALQQAKLITRMHQTLSSTNQMLAQSHVNRSVSLCREHVVDLPTFHDEQ